jgi:uncharacterized protein YgiM (DUF1202 family)
MQRTWAFFIGIPFFLASAFAGTDLKATSAVYRLRMRDKPSLSGKVVGHLAKGESVAVVEKSTFTVKVEEKGNYWYSVVNSSGTKGWVFGEYLILSEPKQDAPVEPIKP